MNVAPVPAFANDAERDQWVERIRRFEPIALSRAISWIENDDPRGLEVLRRLTAYRGQAWVIGITGVPGAGKSTLLPLLTARMEARGLRVAILAVDPSSPKTGGAILGDRIRSQGADLKAFFRSLGSRGRSGGLSSRVSDVVRLLDGAGFDVVLVETVGAGQSEVAIADVSHTVLVLLAPGLGDDMQAMKAGILEIGSVFGVNKADRDGAADTARMLEQALGLSPRTMGLVPGVNRGDDGTLDWHPPVHAFSALNDTGVDELVAWMERHRDYLDHSDGLSRIDERRDWARFEERLRELLFQTWVAADRDTGMIDELRARLQSHELDPIDAARVAHQRLLRLLAQAQAQAPAPGQDTASTAAPCSETAPRRGRSKT